MAVSLECYGQMGKIQFLKDAFFLLAMKEIEDKMERKSKLSMAFVSLHLVFFFFYLFTCFEAFLLGEVNSWPEELARFLAALTGCLESR